MTSLRNVKTQTIEKPELKTASKQIEGLFLNELLRNMLEHTSVGEDKTVSVFLPVITAEISKSLAERGIGMGDFLMKGNGGLKALDEASGGSGIKNKMMQQHGPRG